MNIKGEHLYLKPEEARFLSLAVVDMIEQLQNMSQNPTINWNPEARKDLKNMMAAGNSLRTKLKKLGFDMRELPPYTEGDEKEFLTKES